MGAAGGGAVANPTDTPLLFYSRRIGLSEGREVPIIAGGRVSGRIGRYSLGVLNIGTDDVPGSEAGATNFSVVRVKRDILRKSSVGAILTGRSLSQTGVGIERGLRRRRDAGFLRQPDINTYWARTRTDGLDGDDASYRAQLDYTGDRYGLQLERLCRGREFQPGGRLRPARGHAPQLRAVPVQPPAAGEQEHSPAVIRGLARLHRERRRPARNARW